MKLFAFNAGSWGTTIVSISVAKDLMQIACLLASFSLSLVSIWWILKKNALLKNQSKDAAE
jgi:hypothetical protein